MREQTAADRESFRRILENAQDGDCIRVESLASAAGSLKEFFSLADTLEKRGMQLVSEREGIDTRDRDTRFFTLCRALAALERESASEKQRSGIERAREEGKYKGRKPIAIDEALFESVVALWKSGEITARQAMAKLDLKPNTFYRRIKEMEERNMKDYMKIERELKSEIKEAAKQTRRDLDDLKKQVKAEAREVKKAAEETLELHDVERELRHDRRRAEAEHADSVRQMQKDVEAEARELKQMMAEQEDSE